MTIPLIIFDGKIGSKEYHREAKEVETSQLN